MVKSRVLKLGDGTILQLVDSEIPDPPAVSFVDDILRLNGMWEDRTEHWQGNSVIAIQGHPIAVEYWPLFYRYGRGHQWKGTKGRWTDWRVGGFETFDCIWLTFFSGHPGHHPAISSRQPRGVLD